MTALDRAKTLLHGSIAIVVIRNGIVTTPELKGIGALTEYAQSGTLNGASVADKIVGKAAALLMVYGKAKEVYAALITSDAMRIFERYNTPYAYFKVADKILNRTGTGMCPMEQAVQTINDPQKALAAVISQLQELQQKTF